MSNGLPATEILHSEIKILNISKMRFDMECSSPAFNERIYTLIPKNPRWSPRVVYVC